MATNHIEIPQIKLKQEMVLIVLIACSVFGNYLVPYDKSPGRYNITARLVCRPEAQPTVYEQCFQGVLFPLGQQLQRQYEFLCYSSSINLLNTAMIDCPVALDLLVINICIKISNSLVFNTDFKVIIVIGMVS
jgi:hypothetical protein